MNDMFRTPQPKRLRPHQVKAIDLIRRSLGQGNRRVVLQLATGAGKTLTAAKIIQGVLDKGNRVIFTVPAISLIDQTVDAFEAEGIHGIGVMQAQHPRTDPWARVQVASVQTLARREVPPAALVIVDECHIYSEVIARMMGERSDVFFVGLTATPWAKGMGRRWQDLCIAATTQDLIDAGYLCPFRVFAAAHPDLDGVNVRAGEYVESELAEKMGEGALVADVVTTWLEKAGDRPTLCFAVNRAHAAQLHEAFMRAGVASAYVDMHTDRIERQAIERNFRAGEVKVACSVRTLTTGVDWPVACIIDAAPTKSEILHCLDAETEILTSRGWKGMGEVSEGDCVASCVGADPQKGQWAMVTGTIERDMDSSEEWISFESNHANFRVTDRHRMIFRGAGNNPGYRLAEAREMVGLKSGVRTPAAVHMHQTGVPLNAEELYFIGMMMADGTWGRSQGQIIQSERHPEIIEKIEVCLQRLSISYRKSPINAAHSADMTERHRRWRFLMSVGAPKLKVGIGRFAPHPESVRFNGERGFGYLLPYLDKDLSLGLMAMSREQFEFILDGLWDGDGTKKKGVDYTPRTRRMVTIRQALADRLQALGAINGYTFNVRPYTPEGRQTQYIISFIDKDWRHCGGYDSRGTCRPQITASPATNERVWCVETTTGTIVTRRRGKVTVMGNCQKIGRGLRVNPPWEDCLILDHSDNTLRLGFVTDIHHDGLDDGKRDQVGQQERKEPLPKECPECSRIVPPKVNPCPHCGHERKPAAGVEVLDGELRELTRGKAPKLPTMEEKQRFWSMALWLDAERGKGGRLAKGLYKGKFGVWPRGLSDWPQPPDRAFLSYEKSRRIAFAKRMEKRRRDQEGARA